MVRQCIIEATGIDVGNFRTGDEPTYLRDSGLFEDTFEYEIGKDLYIGDVLCTQVKGHTVVVCFGDVRPDPIPLPPSPEPTPSQTPTPTPIKVPKFRGIAGLMSLIPNPIYSTNEAWFLSNTEKVHYLFRVINEVIDNVNTLDELMGNVRDILISFDSSVKDAVEDYIKEMYDNGTLKEIVRDIIDDEISKKGSSLIQTTTPSFATRFQRTRSNVSTYGKLAGTCTYREASQSTYTHHINCELSRDTNEVLVTEYLMGNVNTTRVADVLRQGVFHLGMAHSICRVAHKGYYIVVHDREYINGKLTGVRNISFIRPTNTGFELLKTIEAPRRYFSMGYDPITNKCYALGSNSILYLYNPDDNTDTFVCALNVDLVYSSNGVNISTACIAPYNDMIYVSMGKNLGASYTPAKQVLLFAISGKLLWSYDIPHILGTTYMNSGTLTQLSFDKYGYSYLGTTHTLYDDRHLPDFVENTIFEGSFITSLNTEPIKIQSYDNAGFTPVYVKGYTNDFTTGNNPTGSSKNPFGYIQQAINYINNAPVNAGEIRVINNGPQATAILHSGAKSIRIVFGRINENGSWVRDVGNDSQTGENKNDRWGNVLVDGGGSLEIIGGVFKNFYYKTTSQSDDNNANMQLSSECTSPINVHNGTLFLQNCVCTNNGVEGVSSENQRSVTFYRSVCTIKSSSNKPGYEPINKNNIYNPSSNVSIIKIENEYI